MMGSNGGGGGGRAGGAGRPGRVSGGGGGAAFGKRDETNIQLYAGNGDYVLYNKLAMEGRAAVNAEANRVARLAGDKGMSAEARKEWNRIQRNLPRIDKSLAKLPNYEGTTYRILNWGAYEKSMMHEFAAKHKVGSTVTYKGFTSTSKIKTSPYFDYSKPKARTVRIKFQSKRGKDVSKYSRAPEEAEVTFGRNTKFRVTGKKQRSDGGWDITVSEI